MSDERQRIDKWLWFARVVKTRTLAQKLVLSGHVRLNRVKVSSTSQQVHIGDVLTIALPRQIRVLEVCAFAQQRGPARLAQEIYHDLSPPEVHSAKDPTSGIRTGARPTKRDRRKIDALHRGFDDT